LCAYARFCVKHGFVLVSGCFSTLLGITVQARVCFSVGLVFQCCCDCAFKQGFVLVVGCVFNAVGNRSLSKV
jgi:hypothetical protein